MTTATMKPGDSGHDSNASRPSDSILTRLLKYVGLMIVDAFALLLVYSFLYDSNPGLAVTIGIITIIANVIVLVPQLYPVRWIAPGIVLVSLLVIYPIFYTVTTAFTNYSNIGHPLPKEQAIRQIITVGRTIPNPETVDYNWGGVYENDAGNYAIWLTTKDGSEVLFVPQDAPPIEVSDAPSELPESYEGYTLAKQRPRGIQNFTFGTSEDGFEIKNTREVSRGGNIPRFEYDTENDRLIDNLENIVYVANDELGYFLPETYTPRGGRADDQAAIKPGYRVYIGLGNFERLVNDPALSGPLVNIFVWTVVFAMLSVLTTFSMGLGMAMIMNDPIVPARKIIRSILLIPYAIPGVISIVIWRGMLNNNLGIINDVLRNIGLIDSNIPWLIDPFWGKFALVLVNLWLGYPYMMLVCSGALQSIPSEVYEAASVDGASPWQKFWKITLPLLFVAIGPLLIGSFVFNFNNYLLITALTGGNPPIANSPIPGVGYTDILISYVYKSAFSNQADYGYASAITIVIFIIVAAVTLMQYRYTKTWEQVGENV